MKGPVPAVYLAMGFLLALASVAQADYVSTFNITQADFTLYGFSSGGPPTGVPTDGPDYFDVTNVQGTYDLDIPPDGDLWNVSIEGTVGLDLDQDGAADATGNVGPIVLGEFASPGPGTSWGPGEIPLPETTFEYPPYSLTLHDLLLGYEVNLDGPYPSGSFGPNAFGYFVVSNDTGGNLYDLNLILTALDNGSGGGDGVMDGWLSGQFTVTAVPEPATIVLLAFGALTPRRRR